MRGERQLGSSQSRATTLVGLVAVTDEHLLLFRRWFHGSRPETQTSRSAVPKSVYAQTAEFNHPSVAWLKRWGFHQDARLRQHPELDGVMHDALIFSLLAEEYHRFDKGTE